jgi:hypothetical protein
MSDGADAETLPAVLQHLGHERQSVHATALVERGQDFLLAANFDKVARAEAGYIPEHRNHSKKRSQNL